MSKETTRTRGLQKRRIKRLLWFNQYGDKVAMVTPVIPRQVPVMPFGTVRGSNAIQMMRPLQVCSCWYYDRGGVTLVSFNGITGLDSSFRLEQFRLAQKHEYENAGLYVA